jgi:SAM-dependent methyltransferase
LETASDRAVAPQPFSYDLIADVYDEDMGRNTGGEDVAFYAEQCAGEREPVLELGCGTGRVTLPLVRAGHTVAGVDVSAAMLARLRAKADATLAPGERARLTWHQADMADADLGARFARVLCPYSAFTYLVEADRRARALANVRRHLAPGGLFVLDVFVPDRRIEALPADHVHFDYRRTLPDGSTLERTKTIRRDDAARVNVIARSYTFSDGSGMVFKRITTADRIRVYEPGQLRTVLESHGFEVAGAYADFRPQPLATGTNTVAFVCRPR